MKKYIAEFFGTFILTMSVLGSLAVAGTLPGVLIAGITLGLMVLVIGKISGAHINPAVTIGAWSLKKIEWMDACTYILAQFAGAALAIILSRLAGLTGTVAHDFSWLSLVAEFLGTVVFTFGVASVILSEDAEHIVSARAPYVIGASLTVGASMALALGSNGVVNPAVAFGIGSLSWAYVVGPAVGGAAGMWLYKYLAKK